jgi:hypothetical protein
MLKQLSPSRPIYVLGLAALLSAGTGIGTAAQVNLTKTNLVERWITNVVEVRVPLNRFVTEYQTNWVERVRTNLVNVFATNLVTVTHTRTNTVWVDVPRTNILLAYRTNWTTLNLTNWSTVLIFRTNWVNRPVTNTVQLDLPANSAPTAAVATPAPPPAVKETPKPASGVGGSSPLAMDAKRVRSQAPRNQTDVVLSVRWATGGGSPLVVLQWRVQSDDGSFLCFGQDSQFTRALPLGIYTVEVKARRDENSPTLAALGTLAVTARDVSLQQMSAGKM